MTATAGETLAQIKHRYHLSTDFPPEVMQETNALLAKTGIDDPTLRDLTALPFVTIDNEGSKDLDQAVCIGRNGAGYDVYYAVADASYYVTPGSALMNEALRRGNTVYLPGEDVPMLPRELCEGLISLNPDVDRRAFVHKVTLDAAGRVQKTESFRARIHSRAQLTYGGVQAFHDAPQTSPLRGHDYTETLQLLAEVGQRRLTVAAARGAQFFERTQVEIIRDSEKETLTPHIERARPVDEWNAQISLLIGEVSGRQLPDKARQLGVSGLYRVEAKPRQDKIEAARKMISGIIRALGLPKNGWTWQPTQTASEYLRQLPSGARWQRVRQAITLLVARTNVAANFSTHPDPHYAIALRPYPRVTAPMREVVGIVTHAELLGETTLSEEDVTRAVAAGNSTGHVGGNIQADLRRLISLQTVAADIASSEDCTGRPVRTGTIVRVSASGLVMEVDGLGIQLNLSAESLPGGPYKLGHEGAALVPVHDKGPSWVMGTALTVRAASINTDAGTYRLDILYPPPPHADASLPCPFS